MSALFKDFHGGQYPAFEKFQKQESGAKKKERIRQEKKKIRVGHVL